MVNIRAARDSIESAKFSWFRSAMGAKRVGAAMGCGYS
jgi:hypothetical protein